MHYKITLFTETLHSFYLLNFLHTNKLLAAVIIGQETRPESQQLIQTLKRSQIPYAIYLENEANMLETLQTMDSDLALVFTFSSKISPSIVHHYNDNIYNIHASDLPLYRGKNPLFWQLRNGEELSALSFHKLTQTFDAGEVLFEQKFSINNNDTLGSLHAITAQLLVSATEQFLNQLSNQTLSASAQIGTISYAKEVVVQDLHIDWNTMDSSEIFNLCRACNPIFGGAKTMWKHSEISLLEVTPVDMDNLGLQAGTILYIGSPQGLIISTKDASLRVDTISVPEGIFSGLRFAKRFSIDAGEQFTSIKI